MKIYVTKSDSKTQALGKNFAKELKPGDVVCLYGNLGFGKTTFVKGVAKGLGIKSRIISPTFTIVRIHKITNKQSLRTSSLKQSLRSSALPAGLHESRIMNLYHIDLYRIENKKQLEEIGLEEILDDKDSVKLIEWPEKMDVRKMKRREVKFILNTGNTRTISIACYSR